MKIWTGFATGAHHRSAVRSIELIDHMIIPAGGQATGNQYTRLFIIDRFYRLIAVAGQLGYETYEYIGHCLQNGNEYPRSYRYRLIISIFVLR